RADRLRPARDHPAQRHVFERVRLQQPPARRAGPERRARAEDRRDGLGAGAPTATALRDSPQRRADRPAAVSAAEMTAQALLASAAPAVRAAMLARVEQRDDDAPMLVQEHVERAARG